MQGLFFCLTFTEQTTDMQIKTLLLAIEYDPKKVAEFIMGVYSEADSYCKAEIQAKFERIFDEWGEHTSGSE